MKSNTVIYVLVRNGYYFASKARRELWSTLPLRARQFRSTNAAQMRVATRLAEQHGGRLFPL